MTTPINPTYRIKRDQRGATLERQNEHGQWEGIDMLPWELPDLAEQLRYNHRIDEGHLELLRIYAMGRPGAEYFPVGAEHHNHGDPVCHSRIGYVLPDYEHPGAYYLFPQPRAFDGQPYPEPRWQGDYWWQTVRLPVPAGARLIAAQLRIDEAGKVEILPECEWRPLEECEQRCTCGARVFPQHKHGCPAGGESWSK